MRRRIWGGTQTRNMLVGFQQYGRTVADVGCRNVNAGEVMVKKGMAWVFDKYAKGYSHLYPVEAAAKAARVGLWADGDPMPPWEWRSAKKAGDAL
jgi:endonuclease YncB( thermonuclease family)